MTKEQQNAMDWALQQKFTSVAAKYARTIAGACQEQQQEIQTCHDMLQEALGHVEVDICPTGQDFQDKLVAFLEERGLYQRPTQPPATIHPRYTSPSPNHEASDEDEIVIEAHDRWAGRREPKPEPPPF